MQAINRAFTQIITGAKQFTIPVFQRDYSWTEEECRQLWDDILRASDNSGHFMGSFVYVEGDTGAAFSSWQVIDGQQRLTTLTLLLIALRDHIREKSWSGNTEDSPTASRIDTYFLRNNEETGNRNRKLALRRRDDATLRALVYHKNPSAEVEKPSEMIMNAYQRFRELLNSPQADLDKVYRGIARLNFVDVTLKRSEDNPQLVFESLNSTGVRLTQSDLIRNYLLMGLPEKCQTQLYNDYWYKLEGMFRNTDSTPDSFLRDYMALKQKSTTQTRADRIYDEFKKFRQSAGAEPTDELLKNLVRFARYYTSFLKPSTIQNESLVAPMTDVRAGGFGNTHAILIMTLYECHEERESLTEQDFIQSLKLIKSYLLRRAVLGLQTRDYWSVFASMSHSIESKSPLKSLQVILARRSHNYRFPSNDEFSLAIQQNDLYRLRICSHILERLENAEQKEPSPTKELSIEHIMPQDIAKVTEWQQMLGADWEDVHKTWLHRLGNLTLTAYNSNYSNKPFHEKKEIPGGFNQSAVRLNESVRTQHDWTVDEMKERGSTLANRALEIWPFHEADERLVRETDIRELTERAKERDSNDLQMSADVRQLLDTVRESTKQFDKEVIEVIEGRSVCYYSPPEFFAELLPMASYVRILLPIHFDEADDPEEIARNVEDYKFLPNVRYRDCGVFIDAFNQQDITSAMHMINQAFRTVT